MKITFHIKELGRLRDTSFDLHPFLIFTGDSNMGKSYCAFLVHGFFKLLKSEIFEAYLDNVLDIKTILVDVEQNNTNLFEIFVEQRKNPIQENLVENKAVKISLPIGKIEDFFQQNIQSIIARLIGFSDVICEATIKIEGINDIVIFSSTRGGEEFDTCDFLSELGYSGIKNSKGISKEDFFREELVEKIVEDFEKNMYIDRTHSDNPIFIFPPARGSIVGASFTMQKAFASTGMYADFLEDLDMLCSPRFSNRPSHPEIMEKLQHILAGTIKTNQSDTYYHFGEQRIPINAAASSIKELSPLFLLLKKYYPNQINLLFEEPESHLHPSMQVKVADLLAYMVNQGAYLQITTHSDYMLSEWNNLLRLYFIKQKREENFQQAIAETGTQPEAVLNPEKVGAYYFKEREDGSVELVKSEINENQQIQFDSFKNVVNKLNENRFLLKEMLEELTEEKA